MQEAPQETLDNSLQRHFSVTAFPTIDPAVDDRWERSIGILSPTFVRADVLHPGQAFDLMIFFMGYGIDAHMHAHIEYSWQLVDGEGNVVVEEKGVDGVKGRVLHGDMVMRPSQVLKPQLPSNMPLGKCHVKVEAYCHVSEQHSKSEASLEVRSWELSRNFQTPEAVQEWIDGYLSRPRPEQVVDAYLCLFETLGASAPDAFFVGLAFCGEVLVGNPWIAAALDARWEELDAIAQRALPLLFHAARYQPENAKLALAVAERLRAPFPSRFDLTSRPVLHPQELDFLWAKFRASGSFHVFKHIVKAIAPLGEPYRAVVEEDVQEQVMQAAAWSLDQHLKVHPLALTYAMATYRVADLHARVYLLLEGMLEQYGWVKDEDYQPL